MKRIIHYMDQRYLDLQQELVHHPALNLKLAKTPPDIRDKLACIATHLGIPMDSVLSVELMHKMMEGFTVELRKQRSILIVPTAGGWSH